MPAVHGIGVNWCPVRSHVALGSNSVPAQNADTGHFDRRVHACGGRLLVR